MSFKTTEITLYGLALCAVVRCSLLTQTETTTAWIINTTESNSVASTVGNSTIDLNDANWTTLLSELHLGENGTVRPTTLQNLTAEDEETRSEVENIFRMPSNSPVDEGGGVGEERIAEPEEDDSYPTAIGPNESAAILSGVFVIIAFVGYVGFITWRKYLERRYGNSEMLITDDVYDISDLRNFEI